jgi:hypothetical protein
MATANAPFIFSLCLVSSSLTTTFPVFFSSPVGNGVSCLCSDIFAAFLFFLKVSLFATSFHAFLINAQSVPLLL